MTVWTVNGREISRRAPLALASLIRPEPINPARVRTVTSTSTAVL